MMKTMSLTLACALLCAAGCSKENGGPAGPAKTDDGRDSGTNEQRDSGLSTDQDPVTVVYEQPAPWTEMTTAQRFEFMKQVVLPEMTLVFQKADPTAKVSCGTCHGEKPSDVAFKMPNGLTPLNVADFPLDKSSDEKIAATAAFMSAEVVPRMAALLEVEVRSRENPAGFGCFSCHARAE